MDWSIITYHLQRWSMDGLSSIALWLQECVCAYHKKPCTVGQENLEFLEKAYITSSN